MKFDYDLVPDDVVHVSIGSNRLRGWLPHVNLAIRPDLHDIMGNPMIRLDEDQAREIARRLLAMADELPSRAKA